MLILYDVLCLGVLCLFCVQGVVNECVEQVAFADKILLNKTDLVDEAELKKVERGKSRIG